MGRLTPLPPARNDEELVKQIAILEKRILTTATLGILAIATGVPLIVFMLVWVALR